MKFKTLPALPGSPRIARAWSVACLMALGIGAPSLAFAGVADVLITKVKTLSENVTYASVSKSGEPLVTYVGYEITTSYSGTNTTNNVRLEGIVSATDPAELVVLDSTNPSNSCRTENLAGAVKLICEIGQVRAGSGDRVLQVFFKVPQKVDSNGVADVEGTDFLTLTGTTLYAEVNDGAGNTNNSSAWTGQTPVKLGTINTEKIKSVLPKSGGKLFSGNGGIPNGVDRFATVVVVPDVTDDYFYTQTTIEENSVPACLNTVLADGTCFTLALAIKDNDGLTADFFPTGKPLTIGLILDKEAVPPKVKPSQLIIEYQADNLSVPLKMVGLCETGGPVQGGPPCLSEPPFRIRDRKNADRDGDVVIPLQSYGNGSFRIF